MAHRGTVKFYNADKGYGFIRCDSAEIGEIFVHGSGLMQPDMPRLQTGDHVEFELGHNRRGPLAAEVRRERLSKFNVPSGRGA